MRCSYRKLNTLRILGLKIFEFKTDYIEHSVDKDNDDDDFYIDLTSNEIEKGK